LCSLNISTDYCAKPTLGAKWTLGAKSLAVTEEGTSWRMQCHCMAENPQRNMQEEKYLRSGIIWKITYFKTLWARHNWPFLIFWL